MTVSQRLSVTGATVNPHAMKGACGDNEWCTSGPSRQDFPPHLSSPHRGGNDSRGARTGAPPSPRAPRLSLSTPLTDRAELLAEMVGGDTGRAAAFMLAGPIALRLTDGLFDVVVTWDPATGERRWDGSRAALDEFDRQLNDLHDLAMLDHGYSEDFIGALLRVAERM